VRFQIVEGQGVVIVVSSASDREAKLPGGLVLGSVEAHESRQDVSLMKPERRSQVHEVE
jgi:hypothetical protein